MPDDLLLINRQAELEDLIRKALAKPAYTVVGHITREDGSTQIINESQDDARIRNILAALGVGKPERQVRAGVLRGMPAWLREQAGRVELRTVSAANPDPYLTPEQHAEAKAYRDAADRIEEELNRG